MSRFSSHNVWLSMFSSHNVYIRDVLCCRLFPHMREGSVKCYELYVIHLARVPSDFAARQNEALVKELRLT